MIKFIGDACVRFVEFIYDNLIPIARVLDYLGAYLGMWLIAQTYAERGYFAFGGEWFIPLIFFIVSTCIRSYSKRAALGDEFPRPMHRLTYIDNDGMVYVARGREGEALTYLHDVERWIDTL